MMPRQPVGPPVAGGSHSWFLFLISCRDRLTLRSVEAREVNDDVGDSLPLRRRRRGRAVRVLAVLAVILVSWLAVGLMRVDTLAREYLAAENPGSSLTSVRVWGVTPAIPPFWTASVSGDVALADGSSYGSSLWLLIEPFTGWVAVLGGSV